MCRPTWGCFVDAWVFVFVLVRVTASYPEVVDVIVETLQNVFTKGVCSGTLTQPRQLWGWCCTTDYFLTPNAWGVNPSDSQHPKYGHTQMDPPQSFEPPAGTKGNDITPKKWALYAASCKRQYMMNVVILVSLITVTVTVGGCIKRAWSCLDRSTKKGHFCVHVFTTSVAFRFQHKKTAFAHYCVDFCGVSVVKVQQGQVDRASPEKVKTAK